MSGELVYRARIDQNRTMGEVLRAVTGMSDDKLSKYVFIVQLDAEKIRPPPSWQPRPRDAREEGATTGSDPDEIYEMIQNRWAGEAMSLRELDMSVAPIKVYHGFPIIVTLYPKAEVEAAIAGGKPSPMYVSVPAPGSEEAEEARRIVQEELSSFAEFFTTPWSLIQARRDDGTFGPVIASGKRPKAVTIMVAGHKVTVTPSGQVRLANGQLTQRPVDTDGKRLKAGMRPAFSVRKDGNVWMRVKAKKGSKKRTTWIRIT